MPPEFPLLSASAKYLRISPTKFAPLLKKIRGKSYSDALLFLANYPQKPGVKILGLLKSAAANADQTYQITKEKLVIREIFATQGSILKRVQPRARGKAYRIEKKFSHLTVIVSVLPSFSAVEGTKDPSNFS
jgi:large subunit ribosomal protein L22